MLCQSEHLRMLVEMITQIRIDGDSEVKASTRGDRDKFLMEVQSSISPVVVRLCCVAVRRMTRYGC